MLMLCTVLLCSSLVGALSKTWDEARIEATEKVHSMSADERVNLLQGKGWGLLGPADGWFVGNIPGVPRLGVPSITMLR